MTSENQEIQSNVNLSMQSIFEWMPACALVIDSNGLIQEVNQKAIQFFGANTKEDFIFDKQNITNMIVDRPQALEFIKSTSKSPEAQSKEILIRRFDRSIVGVDIHACLLPDNSHHLLLQFHDKKTNNQAYMFEASNMFKREAQRLKPYLNKPGKGILEEILITDLADNIINGGTSMKKQTNIIGKDKMQKLAESFPDFSNNELVISGYLSLKMTIDEIAGLTGKSSNSLRVSYHRLLRKSSFKSSKEFLKLIETL
jgi:hypothetical protein